MSVARADDIYDKFIKPLNPADRIHILKLIGRDLECDLAANDMHKITELHGLGKEIWADEDAQQYVGHLRAEWEK